MGKSKTKNKKNTELRIIFFVILVALALFIVSTYAWFTTQKNVSITNLNGSVEVAEGLEISLNAKDWYNGLVLGDKEGQLNIVDPNNEDVYEGHRNISPVEMLPVSTLGAVTSNMSDIEMLRGKVTNSATVKLSDIVAMDETLALSPNPEEHQSDKTQYPGYFAFDVFLKNSSKSDTIADPLQLNYDSSLQIMESEDGEDKSKTGLQNTARVAFARYGSTWDSSNEVWKGVSDVMADQETILRETGASSDGDDVYITDVAIWEPNANDHVEYIVTNNNKLTWSTTDTAKYATYEYASGKKGFSTTTQMPTYALTATAKGKEIENIYDWSGTNRTTLAKQMALQTTKTTTSDYTISEGVKNLMSTSSTDTSTVKFEIAPNSVIRMRIYVWLEGQDVDCINYASHGGGVTVNIGLVKGSKEGTFEPDDAE